MQVSVEAGEGLERRMKIDLPFEQIAAEVDKRLQSYARTARLPGFRPGKVPMKLLRQRFSEQVHHEVFGEMVQSSFLEGLEKEALRPAGMPHIEPDLDIPGGRVSFTAIFEVMPEFELASLSGKSVKRPQCELSDGDLDTMIDRLRDQRKTWEPAERACQQGDMVTISFVGTVEGEAFDGGSNSGTKIEIGSGRMIPGFEDGLVGLGIGEQRTLDLTFPDPYQAEHLAGKPVRFEVTLDAVSEPKLPELDAEFVKQFGVEDGGVDQFKSDVRGNMERELKQRLQARTKEKVMDLLIEVNSIELPKALVESEMQSMADQMTQSLGGGKFQLPPGLFESGARRRVALGLILGKVVKDNDLKVDESRVREAVEQMASTYDQPQAVIDYYYADRERLNSVENVVIEDQVVDFILGQVEVEDEVMSFVELTNSAPAA